jgi:hypothetical protein
VTATVVARGGDAVVRELAAGFEEEGVPLAVETATGPALALAREAARRSSSGIGIGASGGELVAVLAAAPARPYLAAPESDARCFGHAVARIVARRPIRQQG